LPYYTGKAIKTSSYRITYVRNSFGHTQERYKVNLLIRIRSKRVRVELTLADRSNNSYPMLIGKATLRNRFSVDVRSDGTLRAKEPTRILIMHSRDIEDRNGFFDTITESNPNLKCHFATYNDVRFDIDSDVITCSILNNGTQLYDYDLIYFKTYYDHSEIAAGITEVARVQGVKFIDEEVASYHAKTKLTQYLRLARHGISVPDSIFIPSTYLGEKYDEIRNALGERFIMKDVAGEEGESNYLVNSKEGYDTVCQQAVKQNSLYVAQRYIENDGDYRMLVLGKSVNMIISRTVKDDDGTARMLTKDDVSAEPLGIAVRSAVIMNRQVAGVDLIMDKHAKKWFVLEVKNSPQVASGSYLEEKRAIMSRFLRLYAKK